jgi:peptidoglycan/xylan/chitin deacetylase (PgdA/CDA1 family)
VSALKDIKNSLRRNVGRVKRDGPTLSTFLFHSLFTGPDEIREGVISPQQAITVDQFRRFVRHYVDHGYTFIGPGDLSAGLRPDRRYVMVTFDDGYYNNRRSLPVLEEFQVPAVFFISTGHVREGRCFWWDVLYRKRRGQGVAKQEISAEGSMLKSRRNPAIEAHIKSEFGADSLTPIGELDRPFSPAELAEFAASPFVHVGNHTMEHAILTNYDEEEVYEQVSGCQSDLAQLCGEEPSIVSYPNGNYNDAVIRACHRAGLTHGITVERRKQPLPLSQGSPGCMVLGRFTLWGHQDIDHQCELFRSDLWWTRRRPVAPGMSAT